MFESLEPNLDEAKLIRSNLANAFSKIAGDCELNGLESFFTGFIFGKADAELQNMISKHEKED